MKLLAIVLTAMLGGCAYYAQGVPDGPLPYQQPGVYPVYSGIAPICYFQPIYMNDARGRPVLVQRMICQ